MKTLFSILLIFLFISCSGGSKMPVDDDSSAAVVPDGDEDIFEDEDFVEDEDDEPSAKPDKDSDEPEEDDDIEPKPDFYGTVCTGQTKCYDMNQEIPCPKEGEPFYGQDAQYAELGKCLPKYTVKQYDDGETVVNNIAGLEWQRKSFLEQHEFNWDQYANKHCSYAPALGGFDDWRNPSLSELLSLVDFRYDNPVIDEIYFPNTPPEFFLSKVYYETAGHSATMYYEGVNFKNGNAGSFRSIPRENIWFRCVRTLGKRPAYCLGSYLTFSSGDSYQIRNDIQKELVVQMEPVSGKNWSDALYYCEHLTYAGISDWRLPNKNELANTDFGEDLWSSSTVENDPAYAWTIGSSSSESKTTTMNVVCVASNPCGEGQLWTGEKCASFAEFLLKEDGCTCIDGFGKDDSGKCVEQCTEDMCANAEFSTGKCETNSFMNEAYCQCEEGYLHISSGCMTPCEKCEGLEGGDGTCVATSSYEYTCGCKHGYFNSDNQCLPVEDCNVSNRFPCINSSQKFMWAIPAQRRMKWEKAKKYCEDLDYLGYTNWRLPDIDELRTIVSYSDNVKTNGLCKVSEKEGCLSENCLENCRSTDYSDEEYLLHHDFKWSSSVRSDLPEQAFVLFLVPVESILSADKMNDSGMVQCVRNIE
ncbi:DUF1566 domain-containing protein [bacterium]|nr:DUF1566 domain-containing protein [bacterium]